jgi:hypothetical protein
LIVLPGQSIIRWTKSFRSPAARFEKFALRDLAPFRSPSMNARRLSAVATGITMCIERDSIFPRGMIFSAFAL